MWDMGIQDLGYVSLPEEYVARRGLFLGNLMLIRLTDDASGILVIPTGLSRQSAGDPEEYVTVNPKTMPPSAWTYHRAMDGSRRVVLPKRIRRHLDWPVGCPLEGKEDSRGNLRIGRLPGA